MRFNPVLIGYTRKSIDMSEKFKPMLNEAIRSRDMSLTGAITGAVVGAALDGVFAPIKEAAYGASANLMNNLYPNQRKEFMNMEKPAIGKIGGPTFGDKNGTGVTGALVSNMAQGLMGPVQETLYGASAQAVDSAYPGYRKVYQGFPMPNAKSNITIMPLYPDGYISNNKPMMIK